MNDLLLNFVIGFLLGFTTNFITSRVMYFYFKRYINDLLKGI